MTSTEDTKQTSVRTPVVLTFVVPVHNEEKNLELLHQEIIKVIGALGCASEIIYVDDGSTDRSYKVLQSIKAGGGPVRIVKLRANFGQTPALAAGFDAARGMYVVTLDADLQNDPADVPRLLEELHRGYDVVSGWRKHRKEAWLSRRLPSMIANKIIAWLTALPLHDSGCTLKVYRSTVVKNLPLYADAHRFLPAIASIRGARVSEIPVSHRPRHSGRSKYGIGRTTRVLFDLLKVRVLVRFSSRPLHWFGLGSLPSFVIGWVALIVNVLFFLGQSSDAKINVVYTTTFLLFFALGIHFLLMGLLSELAVKVSRGPRVAVLDSILVEVHG
ncbi:MAG: glycosyltransferase family 2 protein [Planctomycetes bacterium]|nr:glycosyltransferase family 2 protein [Planctomycetota bacterium]